MGRTRLGDCGSVEMWISVKTTLGRQNPRFLLGMHQNENSWPKLKTENEAKPRPKTEITKVIIVPIISTISFMAMTVN